MNLIIRYLNHILYLIDKSGMRWGEDRYLIEQWHDCRSMVNDYPYQIFAGFDFYIIKREKHP